ncbi:MAG: biotin--[acetyl-CoA-carboxylase] ligase [Kiritimatiellia bacterium]|jgi:BirA family biotin operon repressor/biotin-[acetyl-CoA-carboxylase] ligase|nr:biotin--[acetyl-CoA-carboxylase] ligase [Kiritimatiellia bacterium]MDP6809852.1 biotin--[acetyl-CoA-carboxylase] ligase [Kiritimatiellia bacterium]MDP7024244.1 biotin--[acetyl-CoA-carboxylase] ligase [Kiritimatiellia bacterium]
MNASTDQIVRMLREREQWVSGEEIGADLGISRSAVSKHIGLLRDVGYEIGSSPRRGYIFCAAPNVPTASEVAPLLTTRALGRPLHYVPELSSTNTEAARRAQEGADEGTTIVSESQSAGQGRLRRDWFSPAGANLYFSVVLRPAVLPGRIGQLPLVVAVALLKAFKAFCPDVDAGVKWPNDILVGGRKLCGILCQSESEPDWVRHVIVGVGINVNIGAFPPELSSIATSLRIETGADASRPALLADVLNAFEQEYDCWREAQDLTPFLPFLEAHSLMQGRDAVVKNVRNEISGRVSGIAPDGGLQLETEHGSVTAVSGDVTVLGW